MSQGEAREGDRISARQPGEPERLALPEIRLELVEDLSPPAEKGFLRLVRRKLRAHYPGGGTSEPFIYDEVDRRAIDAAVIAAHYVGTDGVRRVVLRSSVRPPVYFRDPVRSPVVFPDRKGGLWELPAGLVEVSEQSPEGLVRGAARELSEEAGFDVDPARLSALGPSTFPCSGVIAERHFFFEVTVDPASRKEPSLDGSALERDGKLADVPLAHALEMCRNGDIEDAKTEIGLRRLADRYP
jgi:ADP-ribose pyrophosphatase